MSKSAESFRKQAEETRQKIDEAQRAYCRRHGLTPYGLIPVNYFEVCAHKLLGKRCPGASAACRPDSRNHKIWDHVRVFRRRRTSQLILTSQPYVRSKDYAKLTAAVAAWAKPWNLYWRISNEESWWQSGSTILIEFWGAKPEED